MRFLILILFLPMSLAAFEPHPISPYPVVGFQEFSFFDRFYHSERDLLVWYPVEPQLTGMASKNPWDVFNTAINAPIAPSKIKRSVVIISHGYTGNPHQLSWLIRGLVHEGFIVLGIQHRDLVEGKAHVNHWQRARDVHTILDQFATIPLASSANQNNIGIAGFSLGGTTAVWIAGGRSSKLDSLVPGPEYASPEDYTRSNEALPSLNKEMMAADWRDARVKAAFIMAPGWSWLFDEDSLRKISIPTYLIAAAADQVLVTKNNAGFFARNIPHASYQPIPGKANHYIFISALDKDQRKQADPSDQLDFLFEEDVSIDRRWIQLQVVEEAIRFFRSIFTPAAN